MKAKKVKIELEEYLMLKEFYQKNTGERSYYLWVNLGLIEEYYQILGVDESFKELVDSHNETSERYKKCEKNLTEIRRELRGFKNMSILQFIIHKLKKNTNKV